MPIKTVSGFSFCWFIDGSFDLNDCEKQNENYTRQGSPIRCYRIT